MTVDTRAASGSNVHIRQCANFTKSSLRAIITLAALGVLLLLVLLF